MVLTAVELDVMADKVEVGEGKVVFACVEVNCKFVGEVAGLKDVWVYFEYVDMVEVTGVEEKVLLDGSSLKLEVSDDEINDVISADVVVVTTNELEVGVVKVVVDWLRVIFKFEVKDLVVVRIYWIEVVDRVVVIGADDVNVLFSIKLKFVINIGMKLIEIVDVSAEVVEIYSIWVVDWVNVVCNDDKVLKGADVGFVINVGTKLVTVSVIYVVVMVEESCDTSTEVVKICRKGVIDWVEIVVIVVDIFEVSVDDE